VRSAGQRHDGRSRKAGPSEELRFPTPIDYDRLMKLAAIALIVVGVIALAYGGINYTREKKVIDIGSFEATTKTRETIPLPPILGVAAIASGVAMLVVAGRKR
jgi:uncharacterized membrane protein YidH (DUF202 family)